MNDSLYPQLVERPPEKCILTNHGSEPGWVWGVRATVYAQQVVTSDARMRQFATESLGYIDPTEHQEVLEALDHAKHKVVQQKVEIDTLNADLDALDRVSRR